jgi:hypothetical protein
MGRRPRGGVIRHDPDYLRSLVDLAVKNEYISPQDGNDLKSLPDRGPVTLRLKLKGIAQRQSNRNTVTWVKKDKKGNFVFNELSPKERDIYVISRWKTKLSSNPKLKKLLLPYINSLYGRMLTLRARATKGELSDEALERASEVYRSMAFSTDNPTGVTTPDEILIKIEELAQPEYGASTRKGKRLGGPLGGGVDFISEAQRLMGVKVDEKLFNSDPEYRKKIRTNVRDRQSTFRRARTRVRDLITDNALLLEEGGENLDELYRTVEDIYSNQSRPVLSDLEQKLKDRYKINTSEFWKSKSLYAKSADRAYFLMRRAEKAGVLPFLTNLDIEKIKALAMYSVLTPGSNLDHIIPQIQKDAGRGPQVGVGLTNWFNLDVISAVQNMEKQSNPDYRTESLLPKNVASGSGIERTIKVDKELYEAINKKIAHFKNVEIPQLVAAKKLDPSRVDDIHIGEWVPDKNGEYSFNRFTIGGRPITQKGRMGVSTFEEQKGGKRKVRQGGKIPGILGVGLGLGLAPWEDIFASPVQEGVKYGVGVTTGLNLDEAIKDPSRLRSGRIGATIAEDTIVPIAQMLAAGLRADDIPQEPYYGMGRQRGLLDGHPGIGRERQKRRTNIWT